VLTVLAPAKVNLTIEVLAKRRDGFHEIRSVVQTLNLCDRLHFKVGDGLEFHCDDASWVPEASLVSKAATRLRGRAGRVQGAIVTLSKRIPLLSGLGGDASDATAVLCGLNRLWKLGLSLGELAGLAAELGSDIPFFLYGGTALLEGRGEVVKPLPPLGRVWIVLMLPPASRVPGKTERLYNLITDEHYTKGEATKHLASQLTKAGEIEPNMLFNVFDRVAPDYFRGLGRYQEQFLKSGAREVHLAGSGPALFTLTGDKAQAEAMHRNLKQQKLESYLTHTLVAVDYTG